MVSWLWSNWDWRRNINYQNLRKRNEDRSGNVRKTIKLIEEDKNRTWNIWNEPDICAILRSHETSNTSFIFFFFLHLISRSEREAGDNWNSSKIGQNSVTKENICFQNQWGYKEIYIFKYTMQWPGHWSGSQWACCSLGEVYVITVLFNFGSWPKI